MTGVEFIPQIINILRFIIDKSKFYTVTLARLPGYLAVCENCNIKEDTGDWSGVYITDYKYTC